MKSLLSNILHFCRELYVYQKQINKLHDLNCWTIYTRSLTFANVGSKTLSRTLLCPLPYLFLQEGTVYKNFNVQEMSTVADKEHKASRVFISLNWLHEIFQYENHTSYLWHTLLGQIANINKSSWKKGKMKNILSLKH